MLLSASFKARLGRGLTQLPAALCIRAEAWLMPSQLLPSVLGAGVHQSRRGRGSGIPSEAGLQPSWVGDGVFVCSCILQAAPTGCLALLQASSTPISCFLHLFVHRGCHRGKVHS